MHTFLLFRHIDVRFIVIENAKQVLHLNFTLCRDTTRVLRLCGSAVAEPSDIALLVSTVNARSFYYTNTYT